MESLTQLEKKEAETESNLLVEAGPVRVDKLRPYREGDYYPPNPFVEELVDVRRFCFGGVSPTTHFEPFDFTESEKAYFAALVDGEGCISINHYKSRTSQFGFSHSGAVTIRMVDTRAIWDLELKAGGSFSYQPRRVNHRSAWSWQVVARTAARFCVTVLPYVRLKREQMLTLVELQSRKLEHPHRLSYADFRYAESLRTYLHSLNKRGVN